MSIDSACQLDEGITHTCSKCKDACFPTQENRNKCSRKATVERTLQSAHRLSLNRILFTTVCIAATKIYNAQHITDILNWQ